MLFFFLIKITLKYAYGAVLLWEKPQYPIQHKIGFMKQTCDKRILKGFCHGKACVYAEENYANM